MVERTGFGQGLFSEWRDDRDFVLNRPEYAGRLYLVAGPNFGRVVAVKHAVWALTDYGFQAVISARFGDIFRNNSTKAGLVRYRSSPEVGRALPRCSDDRPISGNNRGHRMPENRSPGGRPPGGFPLDAFTQHRLLEGTRRHLA